MTLREIAWHNRQDLEMVDWREICERDEEVPYINANTVRNGEIDLRMQKISGWIGNAFCTGIFICALIEFLPYVARTIWLLVR